jgi:hypothetical protein
LKGVARQLEVAHGRCRDRARACRRATNGRKPRSADTAFRYTHTKFTC